MRDDGNPEEIADHYGALILTNNGEIGAIDNESGETLVLDETGRMGVYNYLQASFNSQQNQ